MSLSLLKKQLKDNRFSNLYLFFGEEDFLKEYYYNQLKQKIVDHSFQDFNLSIFEGKNTDLQEVWDAIESLPIMAQSKLVVVKDSGIFKSPKAADKEFWENRLEDVPLHICLVFQDTEVDKRSKLYKTIKKNGLLIEFKHQKAADLVAWVDRVLNTYNKRMKNEDIYYLLEHCDTGMLSIKNEIDKLAHYTGDREKIEKKDIDIVCVKSTESKVFQMIDALMDNNIQLALALLNDMRTLKEPVVKILTLISRHLSSVLKVKLMLNKGMSAGEIASEMGKAPFIIRKYINQARHFSVQYLHDALEECLEIDTQIKSGKANDWVTLQTFIANTNH